MGSCEERVIKTNTTTIAVLDDFWADFDAVKAELEKLPMAPTAFNDRDMEDYRSAWISTIPGQELPFQEPLDSKILRMFAGNTPFFPDPRPRVNVNWNRVGSDRIKNDFYNIHKDKGHYTTVVFMNDAYDDSDGFNLYYPSSVPEPEHTYWFGREHYSAECFVRGVPNRAVIFPSYVPHGLEIRSQRFRDEWRCTCAIFHGDVKG